MKDTIKDHVVKILTSDEAQVMYASTGVFGAWALDIEHALKILVSFCSLGFILHKWYHFHKEKKKK